VAMMNAMMRETLLIGTARKAELPGWQAAGKTGTSQDFRDAWFIGYTSHLVTGVWLGNDDSSPTKKATGGGLPVEIWSRFMRPAHAQIPVASLPTAPRDGFFGKLFSGSAPTTSAVAAAPIPPAPVAAHGAGTTPQPRVAARDNVRPQADLGLDGWFLERVIGRR
jgi:penicillin-binding protein 1A